MAVVTSVFGVTKLTGADSKKFRRQVTHGRANAAATASLNRGKKLVKQFDEKGYVTIKLK